MSGKNEIIFRTFKTYQNYYVYDRHTGAVIALTEAEFNELRMIEEGKAPSEQSAIIKKYQMQGLFVPNVVKHIHHPNTEIIEHNADKKLVQLILQVTQQCNLRCEYCAYSGIYAGNRVHSTNRMNLEVAIKAIDFFFAHSIENSEVTIGFYGGEPLLEFELIKKAVSYVKENCNGKKIRFAMTTNGTLLQGERAEFLAKNGFIIGISLDGSKEEHDSCRKFADGRGSFDVVMGNVKKLSEDYPDYVENCVSFFTTVNPYMNLHCVLEFFKANDVINDKSIFYNTMVPQNLKEEVSYTEAYFQVRKFEYIKTLFYMIGKLDEKYVSRLTSNSVDKAIRLKKALHNRNELNEMMHHGGPCMPGILRLFVRYDGKFFPCERVNENLDYYNIGSVQDGFNLERMRALLNVGKLTEEECKKCWNLRHCLMCSNEIELNGKE